MRKEAASGGRPLILVLGVVATDMPELQDIKVESSGIEGLGVFACRAFQEGELIHEVAFEREITEQDPLRTDEGERIDHCTYQDGRVMLVAYPYRHMNHSCDPNAYYEYRESTPIAKALRRIEPGEEVTVDYLVNNPGGQSWQCHCGSKRCRGLTGTSFFDLPIEFQRDYLPLLATWFRERFTEQVQKLEAELIADTIRTESGDA